MKTIIALTFMLAFTECQAVSFAALAKFFSKAEPAAAHSVVGTKAASTGIHDATTAAHTATEAAGASSGSSPPPGMAYATGRAAVETKKHFDAHKDSGKNDYSTASSGGCYTNADCGQGHKCTRLQLQQKKNADSTKPEQPSMMGTCVAEHAAPTPSKQQTTKDLAKR